MSIVGVLTIINPIHPGCSNFARCNQVRNRRLFDGRRLDNCVRSPSFGREQDNNGLRDHASQNYGDNPSDVQPTYPSLAAFRQKYSEWLAPLESTGPVYRLPPKAIKGLKKPPVGQRPTMSDEEAGVEAAFSELCQSSKAIGVWNGDFVRPSYLIRPDPLSEDMLRGLNWTPEQIQTARSLVGKTDSIAVRLKGYVGWLVTEPAFLHGRDELVRVGRHCPPTSGLIRLPAPCDSLFHPRPLGECDKR